jgi:carbon-monoxide dehydrogenase small subunit
VTDILHFTLNGSERTLTTSPMRRLVDVLREDFGLTSVKEGCGEGECGACAVLLDGRAVVSCLVPVGQIAGHEITTLEGLADHPPTQTLERAFLQHGATQCGYCAPGLLVGATEALRRGMGSDPAVLREALSGHICRCTGYAKVIAAVKDAAEGDT